MAGPLLLDVLVSGCGSASAQHSGRGRARNQQLLSEYPPVACIACFVILGLSWANCRPWELRDLPAPAWKTKAPSWAAQLLQLLAVDQNNIRAAHFDHFLPGESR
jgi:hypothetical protein